MYANRKIIDRKTAFLLRTICNGCVKSEDQESQQKIVGLCIPPSIYTGRFTSSKGKPKRL